MTDNYDRFVQSTIKCHDIDYLCAGLAEEVGELMQLRRKAIKSGQVSDPEDFKDELGDILWYVTALINTAGSTSLRAIQVRNMSKLTEKFGVPYDKE